MFNGGMLDSEVEAYAKKWALFFKLFYTAVERKSGSILHLPFEGGIMEQPAKTMEILRYLQSMWIEKIVEETKKK